MPPSQREGGPLAVEGVGTVFPDVNPKKDSAPLLPAPLPNARFDRCFRGPRGNREIPSLMGFHACLN